MRFNYFSPTRVVFGPGLINDIDEYIHENKVLIVTDENMVRFGVVDKLQKLLIKKDVSVFSKVEPNPPNDIVDLAADYAREKNINCVIGLGGGSSMDAAKAIACLITNEGKLNDYRDGKEFVNKQADLIVIPTTSGTGSEVTFVGVYNFENKSLKQALFSDKFYPKVAVIDPELTYSMPARVTASTGLDALCHAIESYWDAVDVPHSDGSSLVAIKKVLDNLEKSVLDKNNLESKNEMSMASVLAGNAFSQTPLNLCHAVSNPITTYYHLEHGFAAAMTLIPGLQLAIEHRREKMCHLAKYCGLDRPEDLITKINDIKDNVGCPKSLQELGAKKEDFNKIVEYAFLEKTIYNAPGGMDKAKLLSVLESVY